MAVDGVNGNPLTTMSALLQSKLSRQSDIAERWCDDGESDRLLARCRALLIVADHFEQAASAERSAQLNPAVLGCLGEALSSLATVSLLLSRSADSAEPQPDGAAAIDPGQLLYAISHNLRSAAEAAGLGHEALQHSD
jgi:hypothetical protein